VHLRGTLTKAGEPSTGGTLTAVDVQTGLLTEAQVAGSTYSLALARAGPCLFTLTFGRTTRKLLLDVPAEGSSAYDLDLPIGWIEGRVRTRAGEPVPDAKVVASASLTQRAGGCAFAHTEPDGTFSIEAAPGEYGVSTGEPGEQMNPWAWGLITGIQLEAGVRLTGLELVTLADDVFPTLEVELKEPSGALVRGGYVRLREASRPDAFVFLDAPEGNATFHRLSGEYRVECEAPGHRQMEERSVRLNRGPPERIEVVLTPVHEVLVTLAAGPPPGPSDLDAVDTTGRVFPALRVAPEDEPAGANEGERLFRFAAVPEGSVLLRAFAGPSVEEYRVDVPPGARDPFRIELGGE
jgi:hypothetical protein